VGIDDDVHLLPQLPPPSSPDEGQSSCQLRLQTREEHAAVEAVLDVAKWRSGSDLAGVLQGWAVVWGAVSCASAAPAACRESRQELTDLAAQALRWLQSDLADLGYGSRPSLRSTAGGPAYCAAVADYLAQPAGSWGVAYVLRGSRLGGAVLAPQIRASLNLPTDGGTRFLASAETRPGRDWVAFRRRLDMAGLSPGQLVIAVDAARWTFRWVGAATALRACDDAMVAA
jgi:heme oxygenase